MIDPADFVSLFEQLPLGAYRSSIDGKQLRANAALVQFNGYGSEAEMLAAVSDIALEWYVEPSRRDEFRRLLVSNGQVTRFVSEVYRHKTRERRWISEYAHVVKDETGKPIYFEGTVEDITERRMSRELLAASERRLRVLTDKAQSATLICSPNGTITYATQSVRRLLGYTPESLVGVNLFDNMHEADRAEHRLEFQNVALGTNSGEESVARHRHADGSWRYLASFGSDCRNDPAVGGMVVYWRDVTDSHHAAAALQEVAQTDGLTGLFNRAHFEKLARSMVESARLQGLCVALYFVDLDKFKWVNDSYGHWVGDQVLVRTAARLRRELAPNHVLARLGGDEFAVIAPVDLVQGVDEVAQRWVDALVEPIVVNDMSFHVSASVGVSVFPDDADSFEALLQHADHAMFAAKANRQHSFQRFEPSFSEQAAAHARLAAELYQAVQTKQFVTYFQPQCDAVTGRIIALEALVRWQHPTRGIVGPDDLIGLAEDQGLITELGSFVLHQALQAIAQLLQNPSIDSSFRVAVNASVHQLRHPSFVSDVVSALAHYDVPASMLQVEVTESAIIDSGGRVAHAIRALRGIGVSVALDDLGVGYSSLDYLRRLMVDTIKIDRDFVCGLPHQRIERAIVRAILALARELSFDVIAEGVESSVQSEWLLANGCTKQQGYLFSAPLPLTSVLDVLSKQS